jgi:2-C-methyl-D-erythritol 4-phosphate cytidylyltransferase
MATLIIPCAGKSSRYPDLRPKWLLTHPDGQLMIEKAVKPLFKIKFIKKYIITITKEINQKYKAKIILEQIFKKKIKILILNKPTKSASETIYETIKRLNIVNGQLLIKDSDCFIKINNNHRKIINKLKILTNNNITNKDNQSIKNLLNILNL